MTDRPSDDVDPMSLDGVNPREYVSLEEADWFRELYGYGGEP